MPNHFKAINNNILSNSASLYRPTHMIPNSVMLDDPGLAVMTDLEQISAFTINPAATIEQANEKMMICGVRLLFVIDLSGNLAGLITAVDILGEKPLAYLQEHGGNYTDILVQDIMTRREKLEAISMRDLLKSNVGDVVETLRRAKRQHILVYETLDDSSHQLIRGIISSTQVERQLGFEIENLRRAQNFAELERALLAS
ncbi:MAG: CBS domain-containing protein [Gammaproteobacteria bacterium]|nr:CBS domain-containing protein [Gammaproteobacteria bacterium]